MTYEKAISYLTPNAGAADPVALDADMMRAALEAIQADKREAEQLLRLASSMMTDALYSGPPPVNKGALTRLVYKIRRHLGLPEGGPRA